MADESIQAMTPEEQVLFDEYMKLGYIRVAYNVWCWGNWPANEYIRQANTPQEAVYQVSKLLLSGAKIDLSRRLVT